MIKCTLFAAAAAALLMATPVTARPMTATDMHMMHRLGAPEVSPDGRWAVFTLSETDLAANKRNNRLYLLDLTAGGAVPQPVKGAEKGHDAVFGADGALYFLMAAGDRDQLFRMPVGGTPQRISDFGADISGFKLSPAGDRVVVWADRHLLCADLACAAASLPAKAEGSARVYDEIFVRHWDSWGESNVRSRLFGFPIVDGRLAGGGAALTGSLTGDTPSKPFGGGEEIAFAPDGRTVYFAQREGGPKEPTSTNLDIYAVPADGGGPPVNLTDDNEALDNLPAVSPDGRTIAYVAMERAGYEADRQVVHLRDLATGRTRPLTRAWDRSVGSIAWARDGRSLLVEAGDTLQNPLFRVEVATGRVTRLTTDGLAHNARPLPDGSVLFSLNSIQAPDDLYRINRRGRIRQLTAVNRDLLAEIDPVSIRRFSFRGANGDIVWGQIVKPAARGGRLPVAFLVHGGPQGSFGNSWSFRWNPRLFTAPGYAAVSVDFHGSTGYGQAFTDAINRDWGGKPLEDLKLGLVAAGQADAQVDTSTACALGGSYGGYMVNWIAGNWADGFDCLVSHAGIFDTEIMAYETEELWFTEWENGGVPWDSAVRATLDRWSPMKYVQNWRTPMLVIHGEKDFRIPYSQSLAMFNALQRRGIPSRLVVYPDENHWILKPKNSIQWYDEVFGWLGRYLKSGQ